MLAEDNVRKGFFEPEQICVGASHLPDALRPVVVFAYITGWRIASGILPLEWRQIDFAAGEVRLEPGTTKNRKGRTFPFTSRLRALLTQRHAEHLRKAGQIMPRVFFREIANGRGGPKEPRPIKVFKVWENAYRAAGCPGRIPHDLRRTAVRNLVRAGIPQTVAMKMTGHLTDSVFQRYDIVSEGDLRDAARRLDTASGMRSTH
jgi:integrase